MLSFLRRLLRRPKKVIPPPDGSLSFCYGDGRFGWSADDGAVRVCESGLESLFNRHIPKEVTQVTISYWTTNPGIRGVRFITIIPRYVLSVRFAMFWAMQSQSIFPSLFLWAAAKGLVEKPLWVRLDIP